MKRLAAWVPALAVVSLIGCESAGPEAPRPTVLRLTMIADSANVYATANGSCPPGTLYCFQRVADGTTIVGTLSILRDSATFTGGYAGALPGSLGTRQGTLRAQFCNSLTLNLVFPDPNRVTGTWSRSEDCHGLGRWGHLTGQP